MATPIPPQTVADLMICRKITIDYKPTWDGAAWVITPADVAIKGIGNTAALGETASNATIELAATDLPPAGQTALNELLQYVEAEMAALYTP